MLRGSCLCGRIRFEIHGAVDEISHCHCSMCRKAHGAAFATFGRVKRADFCWLSGREELVEYASSPRILRTFCAHCGANMQWINTRKPDVFSIALGVLDDDPGARPECHIYANSKAAWYAIEDGLPVFADDNEQHSI